MQSLAKSIATKLEDEQSIKIELADFKSASGIVKAELAGQKDYVDKSEMDEAKETIKEYIDKLDETTVKEVIEQYGDL
jgi:hypothetical protein